jgi:hypothetical protein
MGKRVITNRQQRGATLGNRHTQQRGATFGNRHTQQRGATLGTKHRAMTKKKEKKSTQKTTEINKHGQFQNIGGEPMCSRRVSSVCMLYM